MLDLTPALKFVMAARQAEEGFIFKPGDQECGVPFLHPAPI
jgi:hypothetical protein